MQYVLFVKDAVTLNFGDTFSGQPVFDLIKQTFPVTATLAVMALAIDAILGIGLGTIAGLNRNGFFDSTMLVISLAAALDPDLRARLRAAAHLRRQAGASTSPTVGGDWTRHVDLILPAIVLAIANFAYTIRLTRTSVAENLTADHVRTARAKGLSNRVPSCATTCCATRSCRSSPTSASTSARSWPGPSSPRRSSTCRASATPPTKPIQKGETATVVAIVTFMVMVYVLMSLLVDLLYAVLDPRIRYA